MRPQRFQRPVAWQNQRRITSRYNTTAFWRPMGQVRALWIGVLTERRASVVLLQDMRLQSGLAGCPPCSTLEKNSHSKTQITLRGARSGDMCRFDMLVCSSLLDFGRVLGTKLLPSLLARVIEVTWRAPAILPGPTPLRAHRCKISPVHLYTFSQ